MTFTSVQFAVLFLGLSHPAFSQQQCDQPEQCCIASGCQNGAGWNQQLNGWYCINGPTIDSNTQFDKCGDDMRNCRPGFADYSTNDGVWHCSTSAQPGNADANADANADVTTEICSIDNNYIEYRASAQAAAGANSQDGFGQGQNSVDANGSSGNYALYSICNENGELQTVEATASADAAANAEAQGGNANAAAATAASVTCVNLGPCPPKMFGAEAGASASASAKITVSTIGSCSQGNGPGGCNPVGPPPSPQAPPAPNQNTADANAGASASGPNAKTSTTTNTNVGADGSSSSSSGSSSSSSGK